jgi:hypothetical protein
MQNLLLHIMHQIITHHNNSMFRPPAYLNHIAPYDHRSININDRSWQEGRHSNARPNEPHGPRSGGLPLDTMEKIREEMVELFRDRLRVSVARVGQSYQKPYDPRFDTVPYPQGV